MTNQQIIAHALVDSMTGAELAAALTKSGAASTGNKAMDAAIFAAHIHTFSEWKKAGQSVKQGQRAFITLYLWRFNDKAEAMPAGAVAADDAEGDALPDNRDFYKTKTHLFAPWQVEPTAERAAPQGRFKTREDIMAYNKMLAAQRAAQKAAAIA